MKTPSGYDQETKRRKARSFRVRVLLAYLLMLGPVITFILAYQGILPVGDPLVFIGAEIATLLAGLVLYLSVLRCPLCGHFIPVKNLFLLLFYQCPACDFRASGEPALAMENVPEVSAAAERRFRRKVRVFCAGFPVWLAVMLLFAADILPRSALALGVMAALALPLLALVWTLRCPACGAWVPVQRAVWELWRFRCGRCGYTLKEK